MIVTGYHNKLLFVAFINKFAGYLTAFVNYPPQHRRFSVALPG
jgi:hypothetical protein